MGEVVSFLFKLGHDKEVRLVEAVWFVEVGDELEVTKLIESYEAIYVSWLTLIEIFV